MAPRGCLSVRGGVERKTECCHVSGERIPSGCPRGVAQSTVCHLRRFVTCQECGWVPYVMTAEEKAASDRALARYALTEAEQRVYDAGVRHCLRCAPPARMFRAATERDLARAAGHVVTPVFVEPERGTH